MRGVEIGDEYFPGRNVSSDEEIIGTVRRIFNTQYHACATNKMGKKEDEYAVVDPKGRVYGVENRKFYVTSSLCFSSGLTVLAVRVVDASAFPFLPPGLPMGTVCKFTRTPFSHTEIHLADCSSF